MDAPATLLDDEPAKNTWFYQSLSWRVHDPDEALHIAATHRRHAAEARTCIPDVILNYQQQCVAAGAEQRAGNHDEIVAVCERHAARLRLKTAAARRATTTPAGPELSPAAHPRQPADASAGPTDQAE